MKISELFYSIQGEGKLAGVPSVFVRASGCNLRCTWCDTPYASWAPEGEELSVEQITQRVLAYPARHAVVTGGEPMIMSDIVPLCAALRAAGRHITMETAATVFQPVDVDLASLSPKLSNSTPVEREGGRFAVAHEKQRLNLPVIQWFIDLGRDFQLKFVVADEGDVAQVREILAGLRGWRPEDVLLMPEGTSAAALDARAGWIGEMCKAEGFRFCPRLHVHLYGNARGT